MSKSCGVRGTRWLGAAVPVWLLFAAAVGGCGDSSAAGGATADPDSILRVMAESLLPEVETLAGLPARRPLALAVRTRGELEDFLTSELGRQLPPDRASALKRTYARFGLVPADLELDALLRSLLLEQVVGYYDAGRDTLFVMEGLDPELVEPVLAHEIVHALQDQYEDLDSLMTANLEHNDRATAAQSALEGHATLAMLEWQLGRLTGGAVDLEALPSLSSLSEDALLDAAGLEMPALTSAPRLIRESLIFPYLGGLEFVRARNRAADGIRIAPLGDGMPVSTEQILHPERAFGEPRDLPVELGFAADPGADWTVVHSDGLGELEIRIWLQEHLEDRELAVSASTGWDGDVYRLLDGPEGEVLVWVSAWDSKRDASEFERSARAAQTARYAAGSGRATDIVRFTQSGVPIVVLIDRPAELVATLVEPLLAFSVSVVQ
jgi:hypothetical protein